MRIRIGIVMGVGILVIGVLAWPMAEPARPYDVVSFAEGAGSLGWADFPKLAALAFLTGLAGYFISFPYGRQLGVLVVPAGLSIWALRGGRMASLMICRSDVSQQAQLLGQLKWEPLVWLAIVLAGCAGAYFTGILDYIKALKDKEKPALSRGRAVNILIGLVCSLLLVHFCINLLVRDVSLYDRQLGTVTGQPQVAQIAFGVAAAFCLAAFVMKRFLHIGFIWPMAASGLIAAFSTAIYTRQDVLEYILRVWPGSFFANSVASVLAVQMVSFGSLGAIAGYWLAVRYDFIKSKQKPD